MNPLDAASLSETLMFFDDSVTNHPETLHFLRMPLPIPYPRRQRYGINTIRGFTYCAEIPAARTTFPHLAVSSLRNATTSSGRLFTGTIPSAAIACCTLG